MSSSALEQKQIQQHWKFKQF